MGALRPLDETKILFLEDKDLSLSNNFVALFTHLQGTYHLNPQFVSLQNTHVSTFRYIIHGIQFAWKASVARAIFLNDASSFVSAFPIRTNCDVVQVWHACGAFKKWGASTLNASWMKASSDELNLMPHYKNTSLVSVSSPHIMWAYKEAMRLESKVIQPLGVARTDIYFNHDFVKKARTNIETELNIEPDKKILLYAPTFRGDAHTAKHPNELNLQLLYERFKDTHTLLIKPHPFVKDPILPDSTYESFAYDVRNFETDALLCAADILITDYSSIIFEYSLLQRPMIFFDFDRTDYIHERDFYYDYATFIPGPSCAHTQDICTLIEHIHATFDKRRVALFQKTFMSACDGESTKRICEYIFGPAPEVRI
ncbi:MAG: CDP-glycerol glycerophosphotransferase family protein [Eggerthellaceae bacterium]|nr:CDP-glycerol glycerophosphotransferase family protein [Eggerthellaceae bacterium]